MQLNGLGREFLVEWKGGDIFSHFDSSDGVWSESYLTWRFINEDQSRTKVEEAKLVSTSKLIR